MAFTMKYAELIQHPYFRNYQEHFDGFNMESLIKIIKEQQQIWFIDVLVDELIANLTDFSAKFLDSGLDLVQLFSVLSKKQSRRILKALKNADLYDQLIFDVLVENEITRVLAPVPSRSPFLNAVLRTPVNSLPQNTNAATVRSQPTQTSRSFSSLGLSFNLTSIPSSPAKENFFNELKDCLEESYETNEFQDKVKAHVRSRQDLLRAIKILEGEGQNNKKKIHQFVFHARSYLTDILKNFLDVRLLLEGMRSSFRIVMLMALGHEFTERRVATDINFFEILDLLPTVDGYAFGRMFSSQMKHIHILENSEIILAEILKFKHQKRFFIPKMLLTLFPENNFSGQLNIFLVLCNHVDAYMQNIDGFSTKTFNEQIFSVLYKLVSDYDTRTLASGRPSVFDGEHFLILKLKEFLRLSLLNESRTMFEGVNALEILQQDINDGMFSATPLQTLPVVFSIDEYNTILSALLFEGAKSIYSRYFDSIASTPSAASSITVSPLRN